MDISLPQLKERLYGVFPAIPTPLTEDEGLDEPALERLVEYLLSAGVHGFWVLGSTGEAASLSDSIRRRTVKAVVDLVQGSVPVLAGTGAPGTRQTIEHTQAAAEMGADGAAIVAPYYFSITQAELQAHFEQILEETDIPIMLYHIPGNTKLPIEMNVVAALAEHERLLGIKDSGGDFAFTQALLARFRNRPDFRIFQGMEPNVAASVLMGGHGAVLGMANLAPHLCVDLYHACRQGETTRALALQTQLTELMESLWSGLDASDGRYIGGIKAGLSLLEVCSPRATRPFRDLTAEEVQRLRMAMEQRRLLPGSVPL